MIELGEALRVARRANGITQAELAERVGITQAALSRYESDLHEPSQENIVHGHEKVPTGSQMRSPLVVMRSTRWWPAVVPTPR